jgi:hypothetical protein
LGKKDMIIDRSPESRLQELVRDGLISESKHPKEDLYIYNYTPTCVFKRAWNNLTLQSRGLILSGEGIVVARPFEKFFNVEEESESDIRWKKPFQLFEKLDGSLGILYEHSNGHAIATRGSFASDQALTATHELLPWALETSWQPNNEYTYLFEIIYPENRIVLDYGDRSELVFLCAVHKETGANIFEFGNEWDWPGTHVKRYDPSGMAIKDLKSLELKDEEGFVIFFPHNSTRMKTKFTEYVRLHRIITKTNTKRIWESLKNGDPIEKVIQNTPDEFYGWVKGIIRDFRAKYREIEIESQERYSWARSSLPPDVDDKTLKKEFAALVVGTRYAAVLFKMFDGRDYSETIWKMIQPTKAEGFSRECDEEI